MSYFRTDYFGSQYWVSDYWGQTEAQEQALDPFGASSSSHKYLKSLGYTGGLSTMRKQYTGKGSIGSCAAYNDLVARGYAKGISTARRNFTEDNA